MSWAKLDDQFYDHPKIRSVSPLAAFLWVCSISYSARHLTDGFVPRTMIPALITLDDSVKDNIVIGTLIGELIVNDLWESTEAGIQIHDYLDYNPSRSKVLAERKAAKERMDKRRSGEVRTNNTRTPDEHTEKFGRSSASPSPSPSPSPSSVPDPEEKKPRRARKPRARAPVEPHPGFDIFWEEWWPPWRREKKANARKAWDKHKPPAEKVKETLAWQTPKWREQEARFTPHAASWLNQHRWNDEKPPDWAATPRPKGMDAIDAVLAAIDKQGDGRSDIEI